MDPTVFSTTSPNFVWSISKNLYTENTTPRCHTSTVKRYLCFKEILGTFNTFSINIHLTHLSVNLQQTIILQLTRRRFTKYQQKLKTINCSFHYIW